MKSFAITLPDGSKRTFDAQVTPKQIAASIGRRLEEAAVAAKLNGKEVDLTLPINSDAELAIITRDSKEGLEVIRHSTAHLLAQAIKELFPTAQITIGPVIEEGFYYDIDCPKQLAPEDLTTIEKKMAEIASRKLDVQRQEIDRNEAIKLFKGMNEHYKAEIIEGLPAGEVVSAYKQGDFIDLCRGPHVPNTERLGKFKLLSVAGAYWRGDEKNKMLQRIYGTAFSTQKELDEHLHRLEEAKRRDHRKLGPELELFTFLPVAPAMPFYLPKGAWLFNKLVDFMREETTALGFDEVICPQMMSTDLWVTSGHMEHYRQNMFLFEEEEGQAMGLKPMNCPGHASLFKTGKRSYRELPVRYSEYTKLHRNERGGVTHGIMRTRAFAQDDGHIFCTEDQILDEALKGIQYTYKVYSAFGFDHVDVKLATRPEQFLGSPELWDKAEKALADSLKAAGKTFEVLPNEGAFYGPKIEFHIKDAIGRSWQCGTIQLDFNLPKRFELEYTDNQNQAQTPVVIHRAILGSVERFMGILVEHHAGHLPIWIAPVQAVLINVTDNQLEYAETILKTLKSWGVRAELDSRNEKLGYKIREAQMKKIPLMLVLGDKEKAAQTLSVRKSNGETKNDLTMDGFRAFLEPWLKPGGTNH